MLDTFFAPINYTPATTSIETILFDNLIEVNESNYTKIKNTPLLIFEEAKSHFVSAVILSKYSYFSKKFALLGSMLTPHNPNGFTGLSLILQNNIPIFFSSKVTDQFLSNIRSSYIKGDQCCYIQNAISKYDENKVNSSSFIGIQKHLSNPNIFSDCETNALSFVRLGAYRTNPRIVEAVLRDSCHIEFDINSIRKSELQTNENLDLCGFTIEEACQLMYYIGISSKLKTLVIKGLDISDDAPTENFEIAALLYWYFMEGFDSILREDKISTNNTQEYIIEIEEYDTTLIFYQSKISDKWWFKILNEEDLYACSEDDYHKVANDNIPHRISKYIELSKAKNILSI